MKRLINYSRVTFQPTILFALIISLAIGCHPRQAEPLRGNFVPRTTEIAHGQSLYNIHCQKCHPGGEAGLGPNINWNPAPGFIKKFQIRHGLGTMPSFKENEINDKDLKAISKYIKAYKNQKREG